MNAQVYWITIGLLAWIQNEQKFALVFADPHLRVQDVGEQHFPKANDLALHAVPNYNYQFVLNTGITSMSDLTVPLPLCSDVLYPGYIVFWVNDDDIRNIPLTPADGSNKYELNQITTCNPLSDVQCQSCTKNNMGYRSQLTLSRSDTNEIVVSSTCLLFINGDCGVTSCSNGQYASEFLATDSGGFVTSHTRCLPCAPGTWLTCINDASCSYEIPKRNENFYGGTAIYSPDGQVPVGKCFSCSTAANKEHYGQTPYATTTPQAKTPLPWICPGGDLPPKPCHAPYVGSDENNTRCVCAEGSYSIGGDTCALCSPGAMCPGGVFQACPDDYYQDQPGATSCNPCLSPTGVALGCNATSSMRKCTGVFKAQRPLCVQCNMCRREYISDPAGQVDCY